MKNSGELLQRWGHDSMSGQKLRIVTWNCNHGTVEDRYDLLKKYKPDIAVIQEVRSPKRKDDDHFVWIRSRQTENKCVAIFSSEKLKISFTPAPAGLPEIFMPIMVTGKVIFNLLAVWTLDATNYSGSFEPVLSRYNEFLTSPSIIAGDFNSTPKVKSNNKNFNHNTLVDILDQRFNLVSAYHVHNKIQPGHESKDESTFFMNSNRNKPFHLDYCFVPKNWTIEDAKIGSYDDWCNEEKIGKYQKSDHCPLIVDLLIDDNGNATKYRIQKKE